jgi:alpha-D-ribose 1-methylphosphonate 5-triphosphate synthase subunit PhnH
LQSKITFNMQFLQVISLALGLISSAMASTAAPGIHLANAAPQAIAIGTAAFLITNVTSDVVTYFDPGSHNRPHKTNKHTNSTLSCKLPPTSP